MNVPELFIRRPVMTTLVMLGILGFGLAAYRDLPVSDLPNVDFPTIQVSATLPGASPETMASSVATPLEKQFSTIAGIDSMTSTSALGITNVTLQFSLDRDIDAAAQDVQSAISAAQRLLPQDMPSPPSYQKVNPADQPVLYLAIVSPTLPLSQVDNYAETLIAQRLSTVGGVAQVQVFGSQKYAVRAQVDPAQLASRGIGIDEVEQAIAHGNVNLPTGTLNGRNRSFTVDANGQLTDAEGYRKLIVAYRNGAPVRLGELGTVLNSVQNDKIASWYKDQRGIVLAIQRQPGTNTVQIVDSINKILPTLRAQLPAAVSLNTLYDRSIGIRESVHDVKFTLVLAIALVVVVIFLFLRTLSATLIPSIADDYRARVEAAEVPDEVRAALLKEVDKLERSSEQNPEAAWIRTWLDTVLELPWAVTTDDVNDVAGAREVLDADHHGLDEVKERIVEYLAVRSRRAERGLQVIGGRGSGAVILLAGPPGVGKTSLGESVARAMGRKFVRVSLGGIRDEAEIRGHRRTYVGALPGRIVRAIKEAGSMNPVVLLDEVDKIGADYRGDPAAALLEVLDPAQNHTFRDHYLELDLDLSDVLFIATANVVEQIPSALLDRMELVTLDGYTEDDKVAIARDFLLPRQLERAALTADEVTISDAALRELAANYTREAGVRQMERLLAKALRKAATKLAIGEVERVDVDEPDLKELLGRPRFTPESAERTSVPGVATGLAVTGLGGDVLFIEASAHEGSDKGGGLTLTGQLGDVMKESAQIALSYVKAHASDLGIDPAFFERSIHVHVPAGAVPKDGPSAGVTMVTALTSLATGRPVRSEVGMTGEVTLNGRVLPIGGLKQKLLAAQRNGLTEVFVPLRNEPDLDDVPAEVLEALTVHIVGDVLDVVRGALTPAEDSASAAA